MTLPVRPGQTQFSSSQAPSELRFSSPDRFDRSDRLHPKSYLELLFNASCKQHKAAYTFVSPLVYHTAIQPLLEVIDALSQMRQGLAR